MVLSGRGSGRLKGALAVLCAGAALAAPAVANAAFVEGRAFLPKVPPSERVVRDGKSKTLLVNERTITRITGEGTVDTTFGVNGRVKLVNSSVAVLGNGKILVLSPGDPGHSEPTLTRLLADGSPDPSYGKGGTVTLALGKRFNTATAMTLTGEGRVAIAGQTGEAFNYRSGTIDGADVILRLLPNGSLDPSFGVGGRLNFGEAGPGGYYAYYYSYYGFSDAIGNLTLGSNGQLIAQTQEGNQLLKITAAGRVDAQFGDRGVATVPKLPGGAVVQPVSGPVVLPSGNLIVVGTYDAAPRRAPARWKVATMRLNGKGRIDRNYGVRGFEVYGNEGDLFATGAIEGRGNGVVIETTARVPAGANAQKLGALSLKASGALDPEFGEEGSLTVPFEGDIEGNGLVRQPEARVLLVGYRSAAKVANEGTVLARVPLVGSGD
jgi:uncharacterized delta-60 repeat protein